MQRINFKSTRYLFLGAALLSPIAIVLACSKDAVVETPVQENQDVKDYKAAFSNLKVTNAAVHSQLAWSGQPTLPLALEKIYAQPTFSTSNYLTEAAALASADNQWSTDLPKQIAVASDARYLWVRLKRMSSNYDTSFEHFALNLSVSSNLATVKVQVNALPAFRQFVLTDVELTGDTDAPVVNTKLSEALAPYAKVQWQVGNDWLDQAAFISYITSNKAVFTSEFTEELRIRIVSTDEAKYVLAITSGAPKVGDFKPYFVAPVFEPKTSVDDFVKASQALELKESSTHVNLNWGTALPTLAEVVTSYQTVQYSTFNFSDEAAALADADDTHWVPSLPKTTAIELSDRAVWMRLLPVAASAETPKLVFDLTTTSGVRSVKVAVRSLDAFKNWALFDYLLNTGLSGNVYEGYEAQTVPAPLSKYLALEFKIGPSGSEEQWMSFSDINTYSKANPALFKTREQLLTFSVRLRAVDASLVSFVTQTLTTKITDAQSWDETVALAKSVAADYATELNKFLQATSTTAALVWSANAADFETFRKARKLNTNLVISNPEFSTENFASASAALADEGVSWLPTLPTSTNAERLERHLWVRFKQLSSIDSDQQISVAIDVSSTLQNLKFYLNTLSGLNNVSLNIAGEQRSVNLSVQNYSEPIAEFLTFQVRLLDSPWLDFNDDFKTYLTNHPSSINEVSIKSLETRWVVKPGKEYGLWTANEIAAPPRPKLDYSGMTFSYYSPTFANESPNYTFYDGFISMAIALQNIEVQPGSTHANIMWAMTPAFSSEAMSTSGYGGIYYSTADFTDWSSSAIFADQTGNWKLNEMPTHTSPVVSERHLWARFSWINNGETDYQIVEMSHASSAIKSLKILPSVFSGYRSLDTAAWALSINNSEDRLALSATLFPDSLGRRYPDPNGIKEISKYAQLELKMLNSNWLNLSAFRQFFADEFVNLTLEQVATTKLRWAAVDSANPIVESDEVKVDTSRVIINPADVAEIKKIYAHMDAVAAALKVQPGSTFDNVIWPPIIPFPADWPNIGAPFISFYFEDPFSNSPTIPTSFSATPSMRHLWVCIVPTSNLLTRIISRDISVSSGLRDLP